MSQIRVKLKDFSAAIYCQYSEESGVANFLLFGITVKKNFYYQPYIYTEVLFSVLYS